MMDLSSLSIKHNNTKHTFDVYVSTYSTKSGKSKIKSFKTEKKANNYINQILSRSN